MRLIELEQTIYQETPMITEKLYNDMNLLQTKTKKRIQFYLKIPFVHCKRQFYEVPIVKDLQTVEVLKISQNKS